MSISSASSNDQAASLRTANRAEKEASDKIYAAHKRVEEEQKQSNQSINEVRDQFEKQYTNESLRQAAALESERLKGYDQVRDLQRTQQAQLRKTRNTGERDLGLLKEHYRNSLYKTHQSNETELNAMQSQHVQRMDHERSMEQAQTQELEGLFKQRLEHLKSESEERTQQVKVANEKEYEKLKMESEVGKELTENRFRESLKETQDKNQGVVAKIQTHAQEKLDEIRLNTSRKLSAYAERQSDPFYQLVSMDAKLYEDPQSYTLIAQIPEFEQNHVTISIKGDHIVISGYRRNEETLELSPGRKRNTASFQSFNESFPLSWPVDSKKIARYSDGDLLIFRVAKKNEFAFKEPKLSPPSKIKIIKPRFPENLPKSNETSEVSETHHQPHPYSSIKDSNS